MVRLRVFVVGLALAGLLAGCGGDDDDDGTAGSSTDTTADAGGTEPAATVALRETSLGDVLVDENGMTLYLFTNDTTDTSNCKDSCAATWPPLEASGTLSAGDGVDEAKLKAIDRADGSKQVAYDGAPLYLYAPDENAGDVKGQGVGGVWFVVGADGDAIEESAAATQSPSY